MLKITHKGGEKVSRGNYWNISNGQRVIVRNEGTLPGDEFATYYKANPLAILAVGPVLGLLYAAFLPFIGIAIVLQLVIMRIFASGVDEVSKVSTFSWNPAASFLAGRKHRDKKTDAKKTADTKEPEK